MKNLTLIQNMAFSAVHGDDTEKKAFSERLREKLFEAMEIESYKEFTHRKLLKYETEVFEIIEEMFPVAERATLEQGLEGLVEFSDVAVGDKKEFRIEDRDVFKVFTGSRGNGDISRQQLNDKYFSVPTERKDITLYDELDMFLSGKMSIERMTAKAVQAHGAYIGEKVSEVIYNSYDDISTEFKHTGAYDADELESIIENVKAANSVDNVIILGSSTALGSVSDKAGYSDSEKQRFNNFGYYDNFRGSDMFSLPQAYKAGTKEFAVETDFLIILPADEAIVKVIFEGDVRAYLNAEVLRKDEQIEVTYTRTVGVGAITADDGRYGFYKFA